MQPLIKFETLNLERFHWLVKHNYSYNFGQVIDQSMFQLVQWADLQGLRFPTEITSDHLIIWQDWLSQPRPIDGHLWSSTFKEAVISEVLRTLQWAYEQNFLLTDPTANLPRPQVFQRPKEVLVWQDLVQLFNQLDTTTPEGTRDQAILEVCYSTALHDSELLNLRLEDIDRSNGKLTVRPINDHLGRVVPIHKKVVEWIDLYNEKVREQWKVAELSGNFLFLDAQGHPLSQKQFTTRINQYLKGVKPELKASPELLQNSVIMFMLEMGMDLLFLPSFLGYYDIKQIFFDVQYAGFTEGSHGITTYFRNLV